MRNKIDINYNFTQDTPHYWEGFWDNDSILGGSGHDPDIESKTLQEYQRLLWSKPLPNGENMLLTKGYGAYYLTWNNYRFGSDSIVTSFRYRKYRYMLEKVAQSVSDWHKYLECYMKDSYTIGGEIIFPKMMGGINQSRGCNPFIRDRWDLTIECIRKYYLGEQNPLSNVLDKNKDFFNLFVDFKGYIDFFYLQDCVSSNYGSTNFWLGNGNFSENPLPKSIVEYKQWIANELAFVRSRNQRISEALNSGLYNYKH
ncbi:MAG: hypothetical protein K2M89_04075 [Clostridiales bacterium]|nr:hypothetical protein [Clostridiales bacterium]